VLMEPYEEVTLDVPDEHVGAMTQALAGRKGEMKNMVSNGGGRTKLVYRIPARGLIGFRGYFMTETRGEGVMNSLFDGWDVDVGPMLHRNNGTLVADRTGVSTIYALYNLLPRGTMLIDPQADVYEGMIVGIHTRETDLNVDITKAKKLTNVRSAGADEKQILPPVKPLTLEAAMDFIDDDEVIEVTPTAIRLRKRELQANKRSLRRKANA